MKITKNDLKNIILEELNEAGTPPDIVRLQKLFARGKIDDFIATAIDTPQEFMALINLMVQTPTQLKDQMKLQVLRKAIGGVGQEAEASPEQAQAPDVPPPGNRYEERLLRQKKTRK